MDREAGQAPCSRVELRAVEAPEATSLLLPTVTLFCYELRNSCLRAKLLLHTEFMFLCSGALPVLRKEAEKQAHPSPPCIRSPEQLLLSRKPAALPLGPQSILKPLQMVAQGLNPAHSMFLNYLHELPSFRNQDISHDICFFSFS